MATWQPPIPSGALYSAPARALGAGVALLGYCYDLVQTDGWFTLNLHTAAATMDVPYPTMKFWWQALKASGILAEIQDRGRLGIRARFDDYWLDWRILSTRKPTPETGDKRAINETTDYPESTPEAETGDIREINGRKAGQPVIPNETAYKEDIYTGIQKNNTRAVRAPPSSDHQALMTAYQEWLGYPIPNGGKEGAAARKILKDGYTQDDVDYAYHELKAQDFYSNKHLSLQTVYEQMGAMLKLRVKVKNRRTNGAHVNGAPQRPTDTRSQEERLAEQARLAREARESFERVARGEL